MSKYVPHKSVPSGWGSGPPRNTWFVGPPLSTSKRQFDSFSTFCRGRQCVKQCVQHGHSGVATGWTGVDMPTPLLLKVAPEIDTNSTSFYKGRGSGVAPPPDPRYRLALRARHVCPPHIRGVARSKYVGWTDMASASL